MAGVEEQMDLRAAKCVSHASCISASHAERRAQTCYWRCHASNGEMCSHEEAARDLAVQQKAFFRSEAQQSIGVGRDAGIHHSRDSMVM